MKKARDILSECEADVRAGMAGRVSHKILDLNLAKLPRELRLPFANLCRRATLIGLGLRILAPVVRGETSSSGSASVGEKAEYAVLLQRQGSVREALSLLEDLSAKEVASVPEAHLYSAFCHFNRWEYAQSIPHLESYLGADLAPYAKAVGYVNLAAAFLAERDLVQAEPTLARAFELATELQASRLIGNCRELHAQVLLTSGRLSEAAVSLEKAAQIFASEQSLDALFVEKWRAVLATMRSGDVTSLLEARSRALELKDHESVRDVELYIQKFAFYEDRFHHLYFGSPLPGFRRRIERETGRKPTTSVYALVGSHGAREPAWELDIATGEVRGASGGVGAALNPGKKTHQLLSLLTTDFYRPLSVGALFAELFPDEYFNIETSATRVHQTLRRARAWLEDARLPLTIVEREGRYSAELSGELRLLIPLERGETAPNQVLLERVRALFPQGQSFRSRDVMTALDLSSTSFRRFAQWATSEGKIEREGSSTATVYSLRKAA